MVKNSTGGLQKEIGEINPRVDYHQNEAHDSVPLFMIIGNHLAQSHPPPHQQAIQAM